MAYDSGWVLIMKTFKLLLLVSLVFMSGVVSGVVGTRIVVRRVMGEVIAHPETVQPRIERNLAFRLRLDGGQRMKLHEIMSDTRGQLKDLRQEYRPRVGLVLSNANGQITALLTPEQQARFEKWKTENRPFWPSFRQSQ
jgi:Spy/CpxP family protein refolding chaperone